MEQLSNINASRNAFVIQDAITKKITQSKTIVSSLMVLDKNKQSSLNGETIVDALWLIEDLLDDIDKLNKIAALTKYKLIAK